MKSRNILIVGAHLDDIEIGMGAYLNRLRKPELNNNIKIVICSTGSLHHRINQPEKYAKRLEATKSNFQGIDVFTFQEAIDTNFEEHRFNINRFLDNIVKEEFPDGVEVVFGPSADLHNDHKIVKDLVDVLARPDLGIELYLMYCIPGSGMYNEMYGTNQTQYSKFFFSYDSFSEKKILLKRYSECEILQDCGGIRSIEGIKLSNKYWGKINCKKDYAEQFNIGFMNVY